MCLVELEDFDFWVDEGVVNDIYKFSPMFIHIAGWAYEEGFLNEEFFEGKSFEKYYKSLFIKDVSFQVFVDDILEGKLLVVMFKESAREFLTDYIELSAYSRDISNYFKKSIWDFPQDPSQLKDIYSIINRSKRNYDKHKVSYPDLAIFEDGYTP